MKCPWNLAPSFARENLHFVVRFHHEYSDWTTCRKECDSLRIHHESFPAHAPLAQFGFAMASCLGCGAESRATLGGVVVHEPNSKFRFSGDTLEIRSTKTLSEVVDGTLGIESHRNGVIVQGTSAGEYAARIVLSDDDSQHKAAALKVIPRITYSLPHRVST